MLTKLFTFLLLVTLFFPASVLGGFAHRCQPTDQLSRISCCQGTKSRQPAQAPYKQLSHRCDIDLTASGQQLATVCQKHLIDDALAAEAVVSTSALFHLPASPNSSFPIGLYLYPSGNGPPTFLRNGSFLI
jgi:hypothetical protein